MIALYVVACLHGSLHGGPAEICHEFPIRAYADAATCERNAKSAIAEWVAGMEKVGIDAVVPPGRWRCAPREERGS